MINEIDSTQSGDPSSSKDPEGELRLVGSMVESITKQFAECVKLLEHSPNKYLVGEKMAPAARRLESLLLSKITSSNDAEFKCIAAALLLGRGQEVAIQILIDEVRMGRQVCLAAGALSQGNISLAGEALIGRLIDRAGEDMDETICLVNALERLSIPLPEAVVSKLSRSEMPWQLKALVGGTVPSK